MPEPFRIERITIKHDRIVCTVRIDAAYSPFTNEALMDRILPQFPGLAHHACKNAVGNTFASVMGNTSIPHLFEHLVIDMQARGQGRSKTFIGTTEWIDEAAQQARVEVNFADDLDALRAFRDATRILNKAMI